MKTKVPNKVKPRSMKIPGNGYWPSDRGMGFDPDNGQVACFVVIEPTGSETISLERSLNGGPFIVVCDQFQAEPSSESLGYGLNSHIGPKGTTRFRLRISGYRKPFEIGVFQKQ